MNAIPEIFRIKEPRGKPHLLNYAVVPLKQGRQFPGRGTFPSLF